jgi:hypothetical protein
VFAEKELGPLKWGAYEDRIVGLQSVEDMLKRLRKKEEKVFEVLDMLGPEKFVKVLFQAIAKEPYIVGEANGKICELLTDKLALCDTFDWLVKLKMPRTMG